MLSAFTTTQKGILYAVFGFCTFVISDTVSKYLSASYPVMQVVGWMYLFSLLAGLIFSPFLGGLSRTLRTPKLKFHLARGFSNLGLALSVVAAFQNLPLTSVYPVLFLAPFLITILAIPMYGEKVAPMNWAIIALGFSGVLIAFRPWETHISLWILSAFATVFFIAGLSLYARPLSREETLLSLPFYPSLVTAGALIPYSLFTHGFPALSDLPIFMLGGVMLSCGMGGVASALRIARYAVIAPLHYIQLPLAFGIGYVLFNERPDAYMIGGSLIIALSGLMLAFTKKPAIAEH